MSLNSLSSMMRHAQVLLGRTLVAASANQSIPLQASDLNRITAVDTSSFTCTLAYPGSVDPQPGDTFIFTDAKGMWGLSNVTLTGFRIAGMVQNLLLNVAYAKVTLTYVNSTMGYTLDVGISATGNGVASLDSPAFTGAPTLNGNALISYDSVNRRYKTGSGADVSSLMSPPLTNVVRTNGQVTSWQVGGVTYTVTYDSLNRPLTISDGTVTQVVTWDATGQVSGLR
jgi:hypothetical protein